MISSPTEISHATWLKSTYSGSGNDTCVEVASLSDAVAVRDSTDPDGPKLIFGRAEWCVFARRVAGGELGR